MAESQLEELLAESRKRQRRHPVRNLIHMVLPPAILATTIVLLHFGGSLGKVATAAATSFLTIGKIIILSGAAPTTFGMSALELAAIVFYMDVFVGYLFAYNLHHVYRVPRLGPWLERLQNYCRYWLNQQPWMRKWAFTGVMLFVMFPLTGTGAPGGSILGRIVGLRPATTLFAIFLGSALGCTLLAAFAAPLEPVFHDIQHEWWFKASGLAILAILLIVLLRLGRRLSRAADQYAQSQASGGET